MMGLRPPLCSTRSLKFGESPAMLPRAHTACSLTSSFGDASSWTKMGSAPCSTTTLVCSAVPEAMLVKTQAASNCRAGTLTSFRNCTNRGTTPAAMTSEMGGFCSMLRSLRKVCVALNWACGSSAINIWLSAGICSAGWPVCIWLDADMSEDPSMASPLTPIMLLPGSCPGGTSLTILFFCRASSRVCFRSCTAASSRFRLASSASTPFLKAFCRWLNRSPKPDIGAGLRGAPVCGAPSGTACPPAGRTRAPPPWWWPLLLA
mmetsp:Transcript_52289/g.132122  ORF Transcript_52289/g.132122 Transcript_52289/m.132122 type:complete len:262 (-) Transcript_52289:2-787(-)